MDNDFEVFGLYKVVTTINTYTYNIYFIQSSSKNSFTQSTSLHGGKHFYYSHPFFSYPHFLKIFFKTQICISINKHRI